MVIEKYLVLFKYLLSLLGVKDIKDLQEKLKDIPEGVDSDGRTHFVNVLRSLGDLKISEDDLLRYDMNIQSYQKLISYKRDPVSLKYFQYLAVLFTEIFLDNLKNKKNEFLFELNRFVDEYTKENRLNIEHFTEEDLRKIAFWMATGSGKTLIMHINYHQFFKYQLFSPDNIILITPNEGLSKQHHEELLKSGIPARLYFGSLGSGSSISGNNAVLVIEITKFVEVKKGRGVTLPVDAFEGRNLVFVDEGHKGKKAEEQKWARIRNKLAEKGFVFEYSATFGQILSERNKEVLLEYAKSIIFDYSYKYFYLDGYGKDFNVLNIGRVNISERDFQNIMFAASLLSFYQQLLIYEKNYRLAKDYNLEKPLWIFVGATVTGKGEESDIMTILDLMDKALKNEEWLDKIINRILSGNSGLKDDEDQDVFSDRFEYLRENGFILDDLYRRVFGGKGNLRIHELKKAEGEFGLKAGENEYFGVVNIGDVSSFKKQLENKGVKVETDAISESLFDIIKREDSSINILIGSRKFIEGWDTWRVTTMGLLNIGRGQGPQIIQLFGRGVRLKGKGWSLKRSGDKIVNFLETLNIYGIKANYLNKFLDAIRREEVEFERIIIPIRPLHKDKWKILYLPLKDETRTFEEERILKLEIDDKISITVDLTPRMFLYSSIRERESIKAMQIKAEPAKKKFTSDIIDLFDWDKIWEEICRFKIERGYWNLVMSQEILRRILLSDRYTIILLPEKEESLNEWNFSTKEDLRKIEDIAILLIKKYIDRFVRKHKKQFETENIKYQTIEEHAPLAIFSQNGSLGYAIKKKKKEQKIIHNLKNLITDINELLKDDMRILPRIYFDRSLYVPILLENSKIKITPAGLVKSEKIFVMSIRDYIVNNKEEFSEIEVFLLRNFPRYGVGFHLEWGKYYPDFIMWIKKGDKQIVAFIDPKGLMHTRGLDDEKIQFCKDVKKIEAKLNNNNILLEAFIISQTQYKDLIKGNVKPPSKVEYEKCNVLFMEDLDWPKKLFNKLSLL